jgi:hypothetical protein
VFIVDGGVGGGASAAGREAAELSGKTSPLVRDWFTCQFLYQTYPKARSSRAMTTKMMRLVILALCAAIWPPNGIDLTCPRTTGETSAIGAGFSIPGLHF